MKRTLLALALASAGALAFAQAPSFQCGGIGQDDQARMKAEAAHHDALLTFAVATGAYLSDVDVKIADSRGATVLQGHCDGPLMLVDLPGHGSYQVSASAAGRTQHKAISLGGKPASATFVWPAG